MTEMTDEDRVEWLAALGMSRDDAEQELLEISGWSHDLTVGDENTTVDV